MTALIIAMHTIFYPFLAVAYNPNANQMTSDERPKQLEGVGVTERLGERIDLNLNFRSDMGEVIPLAEVFDGQTPVLMTMVYYNCPSLCNYHLNGLKDVFKQMEWNAGRDFKVVAVSMDHREGFEVASMKKDNYIEAFGRLGVESGWHFLTGTEENIKALSNQLGVWVSLGCPTTRVRPSHSGFCDDSKGADL